MSENSQKTPPTFVDRTDHLDRAEGLMRVVDSLLNNPEVPEDARRELQNHEIVQRLRSALTRNR